MSIAVSFASHMNTEDKVFENFSQLRDHLRSVAFSYFYRMRSHQNEHGRVVSRELLAVADDGRETYLGNVTMDGDTQ